MINFCPTTKESYAAIIEGVSPWIALGNFLNGWYAYATDRRAKLIEDAIVVPEFPSKQQLQWAAYCAASVEFLCATTSLECPLWVHDPLFILPELWYSGPGADLPHVQAQLFHLAPEPFKKRNIASGNRMFANKYGFAAQYALLKKKS